MHLETYVESLRSDLLRAAEAAGPEARDVADRLLLALDPAVRMALLEALSDSAAEITADLPHAAVEVRLKGREPQFVVSPTEPLEPAPPVAEDDADESDEQGTLARVTVRIPEGLKARAEEAAAAQEQSLNSWIVNAVRHATRGRFINIDLDLGNVGFGRPPQPPSPPGPSGFGSGAGRSARRIQGWAR